MLCGYHEQNQDVHEQAQGTGNTIDMYADETREQNDEYHSLSFNKPVRRIITCNCNTSLSPRKGTS